MFTSTNPLLFLAIVVLLLVSLGSLLVGEFITAFAILLGTILLWESTIDNWKI